MAKLYRAPETIAVPKFDPKLSYQERKAQEDKYEQELISFCKENSKCPHAGSEIRFPIGDGFACYIVYDYRSLIHVETGDAYCIGEVHARGLLKADIIKEVNKVRALNELFSGANNKLGNLA